MTTGAETIFAIILALFIILIPLVTAKLVLRARLHRAQKGELQIKTPMHFVQRPPQALRKASQATARTVTKDNPAARRR